MRLRIALLVWAMAFGVCNAANAQNSGHVIIKMCENIHSSDGSAHAMADRVYCMSFIKGALLLDRHNIRKASDNLTRSLAGGKPATPIAIASFLCFPHSQHTPDMGTIAEIGKGWAAWLRTRPPAELEQRGPDDDFEMRLFTDYVRAKYPCGR